jgi:hypothetical protein
VLSLTLQEFDAQKKKGGLMAGSDVTSLAAPASARRKGAEQEREQEENQGDVSDDEEASPALPRDRLAEAEDVGRAGDRLGVTPPTAEVDISAS